MQPELTSTLLALATSIVGAGAIAATVVALFGHSGRAEVSAERRFAMAAGQADRRTVFESSLLAPLMWLLLRLVETLNWPWAKRRLRVTLVAAGSPKLYTAEEYMALATLCGLAGAVALGGLTWAMGGHFSFVSAFSGFIAGIGAAVYHISDLAAKRLKVISRRVPFTLDLVALAMGAGSTFTEAVRTVTREAPEDPMNAELATVLAEMELGTTRRQALKNLSDRVPLESLRSIMASVIQAEELGTPLADVLRDQSALLRLHRSVRAEKMAALASVRILLPNLLILISVVLCVFAPIIIRAIRGELF